MIPITVPDDVSLNYTIMSSYNTGALQTYTAHNSILMKDGYKPISKATSLELIAWIPDKLDRAIRGVHCLNPVVSQSAYLRICRDDGAIVPRAY